MTDDDLTDMLVYRNIAIEAADDDDDDDDDDDEGGDDDQERPKIT